MAQIQNGYEWDDGEICTAEHLNQMLNSAILNPEAITNQAPTTTPNLGDKFIIYKSPALTLNSITLNDILSVEMPPLTVSQLFATSNLTISATDALQMSGLSASITVSGVGSMDIDIACDNDISIGGTQTTSTVTVVAPASFTTTSAVKIPVGTTAQRPSTPVSGQIRYNSTTASTELYNGASWTTLGGTYSLYEIYEVTPTSYTASASGAWQTAWTSASITKPSSEIWILELDTTCSTYGKEDFTNIRSKYGSGAVLGYDEVWSNHFGGSGTHTKHILFKTVVPSGTALSSETYVIEIYSANTPTLATVNSASYPSKFRIYKYKL